MNPSRESRTRAGYGEAELGRAEPGQPDGPAMMVGTVVKGGTAFPAYYAVQPVAPGGTEREGLAPSNVPVDLPTLVAFYGRAPSAGEACIAAYIPDGSRWVALTGRGGGGIPIGSYAGIPGCFCTQIPPALAMTSADPTCNYRMFQSCTLVWQSNPAVFASLNLGPNIFLSTESFPDPIAAGAKFYYYLICYLNQFSLTRLYPTSPYGSPFRDAILYTWLLGGYGNTCTPFHLDNGVAFPGSDLSCSVTIDQL